MISDRHLDQLSVKNENGLPCEAYSRPDFVRCALWIAWGALILLAFASHLAFGYETDELFHLHQAWSISNGMLPYRDFYAAHFPLFHYLVAPLLKDQTGSPTEIFLTVRVTALAISLVCTYLFYRLACRAMPREYATWALGMWLVAGVFGLVGFELRPDWLAMVCLFGAAIILQSALLSIRRTSIQEAIAAGVLLGISACLTQKALLLVPGFAFWLFSCWKFAPDRPTRGFRGRITLAFLAAAAVPMAVMIGFFASNGAAQELLYYTIIYPFHLPQLNPWRRLLQAPLMAGFGVFVLAGAQTVAIARQFRRHYAEASMVSLLAGLFLLGVLSYVKSSGASRQWMEISIVPWCAVLSASCILRYARDPWLIRGEGRSIAIVAAFCLFGLEWYNIPVVLAGWSLFYFIGRWLILRSRDESAHMRTAFATLMFAGFVLFVVRSGISLHEHLGSAEARQLDFIAVHVPAGAPVLQPWPNVAVFRPHPTYHWFDADFMFQGKLCEQVEAEYIDALRSGDVRYVYLDAKLLENDFPRLRNYLETNCRRETDLPVSRHNLLGYTCGPLRDEARFR